MLLFVAVTTAAATDAAAWKRLVHGNVVLYCHESDLGNGASIVSIIDGALPRLLTDVGLAKPQSLTAQGLTIFLASTRDEFQGLTGGAVPEWSSGAADARRAVLFLQSPRFADPDEPLERVVVHELAHAVLGAAMNGVEAERWFEEGFAMLESGETGFGESIQLMWNFLLGQALPLSEIEDVLTFKQPKAALAYRESRSAVNYFVEQYGSSAVGDLIAALRMGRSMDQAMVLATGISMKSFEAEWFNIMTRRSRNAVIVDGTVVLSVVFTTLFFAALVATRVRTRRIQEEWAHQPEQNVGMDEIRPPLD